VENGQPGAVMELDSSREHVGELSENEEIK